MKVTFMCRAANQVAALASVVVPSMTQMRAPSSCSALVKPSSVSARKPWPS